MFSALHQGSPLYLLEKATLSLKIGQVQGIGIPKTSMPQAFSMGNTTIDVTVVSNGESIVLPNIPSNLSVATVNGIIASETREALDAEIDGIQRELQNHVDNRDEYIRSIDRCKEVRKELNPQLAEEQRQKERIAQLEKALAAMQAGQDEMKAMLAQALNSKKQNDNDHHPADRNR